MPRATKKKIAELKVKEGIIYNIGEINCHCGKHFVIKCDEKHKTHWIE